MKGFQDMSSPEITNYGQYCQPGNKESHANCLRQPISQYPPKGFHQLTANLQTNNGTNQSDKETTSHRAEGSISPLGSAQTSTEQGAHNSANDSPDYHTDYGVDVLPRGERF
jgi:hypothetical protein